MTPARAHDEVTAPWSTSSTGGQWEIGHGTQRAIVCEVGATLRAYSAGGRPVVDGFGDEEWSHGGRGQVLAPWPNRLGDGHYRFGGIEAQAALDEVERHNAIHGLVRWLPWRASSWAQNKVCLCCDLHPSPGYPFRLRLGIEYRLGRDGLTVTAEAENLGQSDLPFGLGFHPYLTVGTQTVDDVRLRVPARRRLVTDGRGLPVGVAGVRDTSFDFTAGRPIGTMRLDTAFCDLERDDDGRARVTLEGPEPGRGVTLWLDDRFTHVMVFTGDTLPEEERRRSVAVEPM
ncbi:MAG TPA: aldose 1-epimerase family protein, partial [Acidimicrobiales bacterium]|nr:aldose 1-epimerase family protein [Acidimicrobiales bacterium]